MNNKAFEEWSNSLGVSLLDNISSPITRKEYSIIYAHLKRAWEQGYASSVDDSFIGLVHKAIEEANKAIIKFPQPNYVISKIAEEAGEVVKASIHCAEGREHKEEVIAEMVQLIAMLYRLWIEGDEVHGLTKLSER